MALRWIAFTGILGIHVLLAGVMFIRVFKTNLFTTRQKIVNSVILLLLPFVWSVLMYYMLRKEPVVFDEDKQHKRTDHGFYESGKGFQGRWCIQGRWFLESNAGATINACSCFTFQVLALPTHWCWWQYQHRPTRAAGFPLQSGLYWTVLRIYKTQGAA